MAVLKYVTQFETRIREMYGHELISNELFNSNPDIERDYFYGYRVKK